ncbi:MAG TPA: threonine synthase, partial [Solirubrobacteraceae bacterium]|nr:threonine synthase [Solirubrobacteraceae bacterium]
MSPQTIESPAQGSRQRTRSCATGLACHRCENSWPLESTVFVCPDCGKGLDVVYDYELAASHFRDFPAEERPQNIWHFEELLPIVDASAQARVGQHSGYTPLIRAERLGAELGLSNLYIKDDSSNRPSLSYKDRVVSMSVARLLERGKDELGCVSTGNVGTAVASLAAKAGVAAYICYPNRLEDTKAQACAALGAKVFQVEGNYDEANRRCREVAEDTGMDFANITLRPFYAEGAKTASFEIVEQLGWESPEHIVSPAAGGTLSSRMHKGLNELQLLGLAETQRTAIHIAQPSGCNPIASAILAEEAEVVPIMPETAAHSLAIGAPGDGYLVIDAVHKRGGTAAFASDPEIFAGIDLLAATEGLLTEPAGGTTIAVLEKLASAGRF